jgi:hypothetical protein
LGRQGDHGRPTLYTPETGELARKVCMLGATNEELAGCFEVARSTIDEWLASIPEFAEGVRQGLRNRRPRHWLEKAEPAREEEEEFDMARVLDAAGESMRFVNRDARSAEEE